MAYYVKSLRKKEKGQKIVINLNIKEYTVLLYRKSESENLCFNAKKGANAIFPVENYQIEVVIPNSGFWEIAIKSKKKFSYLKFLEL